MSKIIYKAEIEAGLSEKIKCSNSIAYCSPLVPSPSKLQEAIHARVQHTSANHKDQPDLYYLQDLLVSTGWNLNTDIFTPSEVWTARKTPEDKPLNIEHNEKDIVGHIIANFVVDDENNIINDDVATDDLPDSLHIITPSVLYLAWEDASLVSRMEKLIAEIERGEWFVSMEALFNNFDYGVIDDNGNHTIIQRNEDTAFLTKHLFVYGGDGLFDGNKIGRVLRNIIFSGKGLVRNPANPKSVIFNDMQPFTSAYFTVSAETGYNPATVNKNQEITMADNVDTIKQELNEMKATVTRLQEENAKAQTQILELTSRANLVDTLQKDIVERDTKIKSLEASVETVKQEKVSVDEMLVKIQAELDKSVTELQVIREQQLVAHRTKMLKEANASEDVIESMLTLAKDMDEGRFKTFVELVAKNSVVEEDNDDDTTSTTDKTLANAEADNDVDLATSDNDKNIETVQASIGQWFRRKHNKMETK